MRFVILHYHIFKNAGSTVEDILDHSFGDRYSSLETDAGSGLISNSELVRYLDTKPELRAFSSHQIRYPLPLAREYLFFDICFLRDPLDRVRSFYDYFRQRPNPADPMSELANRCSDLGDFVAGMIDRHSLFIRNNQVNLLACGGDSDEPTESDFELAAQRALGASFLGVVDCFEQSAAVGREALRCAFPELDCSRPAVNVSKGMSGTVESRTAALRAACRPEVFEELLRITELDRRLVELARAEVLRRFISLPLPYNRGSVTPARRPRRLYWRLRGRYDRDLDLLFDPVFYLDRNPDVRDARIDPLLHYIRNGAAEGRKPHPLFDPAYYRITCGESPANPLLHFLACGVNAANPHPLFDCAAYRAAHPEVDENPLVHYLKGEKRDGAIHIQDAPVTGEAQQQPFLRSVSADQINVQVAQMP